ncbi:bifunctional (p)ppGpp synthetase/guanosine-3',5'-bis(diphosphate) 3'-pyrophosphohydrolase [Candidatus Woesearchaeota archaeon]|nr:bifunctional (p)ppGpp synthetase/guanosine-3',5'-bis(diphosphate) 3'-pyrophosphohydrolase [Candidatus Woesearchaeota archaeon]
MRLFKLLKELRSYNKNADIKLVSKAYSYAKKVHKDKKRASGELFIQHPLNVAYILAQHKSDDASIAAALLHDVLEDSNTSLEDIKSLFGEEIANLVDGLTKLTTIKYEENREIEYIRKMLIYSARDIRIIIIKLADKLHNMRTIEYLEEYQVKRICQETLDIYAPLAHKLGMASVKDELEDLAFMNIYPEIYRKLKNKFKKSKTDKSSEAKRIKTIITKNLKEHGINALITGRTKTFYSIYKKMMLKKRTFEEIYDIIGLRIITDDEKECYEILGLIHNLWTPIPGEFDDYIAMPKPNMYQSLHTTVMAFNQPVEFQIRTYEMDKIAEEGIAAHWGYKGIKEDKKFDKRLVWLRQIINWETESSSIKEFMEFLKGDIFEDEIYIFTPKGDVINLPKESCPIDFAYAVHSNIGERCIGAVVNGRIVPLRYQLKTGDIVNILTSKKPSPRRDWLKIVKTAKAKNKIIHFIREHEKIPIANIRHLDAKKLIKDKNSLISINKNPIANYKLSKCCNPLPGDRIIAHLSKNKFSIHTEECEGYSSKKIFEASWIDNSMPIWIKIVAKDRVGLFADVLNTVAATGTNVDPAKSRAINNNFAEIEFGILAENLDHIKDLVSRVKRVKSVTKVSIEQK